MKRIIPYILFVATFFALVLAIPLTGFIANSISACISTIVLYAIFRKITFLELVLLFVFIFLVPVLILIRIGIVGDTDWYASMIMLGKHMDAISVLCFLSPIVAGICTLFLLKRVFQLP